MKILRLIIVASIIFYLGAISHLIPSTQNSSAEEKKLWKMEEAYLESGKKGDLDKFSSFWHKDFLGWPSFAPEPVNTESGKALIEDLLARAKLVDFEIKPSGIRIFGDVAIVHYSYEAVWQDLEGNKERKLTRITHTWMKTDGEWKIIGGMEYPLNHGNEDTAPTVR